MEILILIVIAGVAAVLWNRTGRLEAHIGRLEEWIDVLSFRLDQQAALPDQHDSPAATAQSAAGGATAATETEDEKPEPEPQIVARPAASLVPAMRQAASEPTAVSEPLPEPLPEQAPAPSEEPAMTAAEPVAAPRFQIDFEDIFGRLLPIWAGGVALAVAGFFLVRYSIEQGLLGPQVRVSLGFLFGLGLLGGAEVAYRQEYRLTDPRVRQALAGAGLATLYASFYMAGSLYGLVGSTIAFLGLAGVTGAAILLSFRFGLPSAILGLVGGFAAPMLVGSDEANLPLLAVYLALVTGGLTFAGNRQGRSWLALAALGGGLGWGALLLFSGITGFTDVLAFGGYLVVLGAIVPAFTDGRDAGPIIRIGAAALAAIQMAAMVHQAGYSLLAWSLYALLAAALAFFAFREPRLRETSAFAAGLALVMLALWTDVTALPFTITGLVLTAIFAGVPLANIWRGAQREIDIYQLGGFALGLIAVTYSQFAWAGSDRLLALACLAIAVLPALGSWLLWPAKDLPVARGGLVTLASAAIGVALAGLIATPVWMAPMVLAAVTLGLIAVAWRRHEKALNGILWAFAASAPISLLAASNFAGECALILGLDSSADMLQAMLRWIAAALPFAVLTLRSWPARDQTVSPSAIVALSLAGGGAALAGMIATPIWMGPLVLSAVTLTLLALVWKRQEAGFHAAGWSFAAGTVLVLMVTPGFASELRLLFGIEGTPDIWRAIARWTAAALPLAVIAGRQHTLPATIAAEIGAAAMLYGIAAQIAPADSLAWIAAAGAGLLAVLLPGRIAARLTAIALAFAWAAQPLGGWLVQGFASIWGEPMLIASEIGWHAILLQMAPLLAALGTLLWQPSEQVKSRLAVAYAIGGVTLVIAFHMIFKQTFHLETMAMFAVGGLAERTIWQAILLGTGLAAIRLAAERGWPRFAGPALMAGALVHFVLYTLHLHNPLWTDQAVGAWPIVNLLLPSYAIAIVAILQLKRMCAAHPLYRRWMSDTALMVLIGLLALSELRQIFAGTLLMSVPVSQSEDLLRSLLGIVLAIGFLLWGARTSSRGWRIGSLVLMLGAVLKVFLFDTSGLEGLMRVASFVALGFSLIGIGWFYARQLARPKPTLASLEES